MRPSSKEIIDGISWIMDDRIAPLVDDKWGASYLRSVKGLLQHLSVRAEAEGEILWEDLADQRNLLTNLCKQLGGQDAWRDIVGETQAALGQEWRKQGAFPTIASLEVENLALRTLIEQLLHLAHNTDGKVAIKVHEQLTSYLKRMGDRERVLYKEPFSGLPF